MRRTTHVGPFGSLVEVTAPRVSSPIAVQYQESEVVLLSGRVRTQRSHHGPRRWRWEIPAGRGDELDRLMTLHRGAYGPPPWRWYDPTFAFSNMLPEEVAVAGKGPGPWRWLAEGSEDLETAGLLALPDGQPLAFSVEPAGTLVVPRRNGTLDPVPVLPGRTYTASAHVAEDQGTVLALVWVDADGDEIARTSHMSVNDSVFSDDVDRWEPLAPDDVAVRSTDQALIGPASMRLTRPVSPARAQLLDGLQVVEGDVVSMSAWFRPDADERVVTMQVRWFTEAEVFISQVNGPAVPEQTGQWVKAGGTFTAPADAGIARCVVRVSGTENDFHFVDDVRFARDDSLWQDAGGRYHVTAEAPAGAAGVLIALETLGRTGGLQLVEGHLGTWRAGEGGIPRVTFSGLEQAYQLATADHVARDVTVELIEVG